MLYNYCIPIGPLYLKFLHSLKSPLLYRGIIFHLTLNDDIRRNGDIKGQLTSNATEAHYKKTYVFDI